MLDNQGFVVSTKQVKDGASTTSKHVHAHTKHLVNPHQAETIANDVVGTIRPHPESDKTDAKIQRLRKFQGKADMLWTGEFVGMLGGGVLGWVATKTKSNKFGVAVKSIFSSPFEALRETKLNQIHQLPANYMKSVANHANAIGGSAAGWGANAEAKAASLEASGKNLAASVSGSSGSVLSPVKETVRSGLNSAETTGIGKHVLGGFQKLASWRADVHAGKHLKHLSKAEAALTEKPAGFFGFIDNIKYFFTGGGPKQLPPHDALKEVTEHLSNARSATTSADRMLHMNSAKDAAKKLAIGGQEEVASRATHVLKSIEKSNASAGLAHHFGELKGQGLAGLGKALSKAVGRVPVFGAIIGLGVAAGVSATVITHKKENKIAKQARNEIAAAIGDTNPLMVSIDKSYHKDKGGRVVKSGLSMVSDFANLGMAASPMAGGMGYMAASMLPMGASMFIKENMMLNAYANLRMEETRGMKLPPEAKLVLIRQLVASVPSVKKAGGYYNNLTLPVAEAIMDKNLSAKDTMQLLANETQFSALATNVLNKQKELSAAVAAQAPVVAANENKAPLIEGKPTVSGIVNEGRVAEHKKMASV